jgi:hypothetical protein
MIFRFDIGTESYYRYKTVSMMRNSSNTTHIESAMLKTRHLRLYSIDAVFNAHKLIGSMPIDM